MNRFAGILIATLTLCPAQAALLLGVDGVPNPTDQIYLDVGLTAVISIHGDGQTPSPQAPWLIVQGHAQIDCGKIIYSGSLSDCMDMEDPIICIVPCPDWEELLRQLAAATGHTDIEDFIFITLADTNRPPAPLQGLLVDQIIFTCKGRGDVTLFLINDDLTATLDSQLIHQIPEPATLLLLALGGLISALKRRRGI